MEEEFSNECGKLGIWTYPSEPPIGDFEYILDEFGLVYNKDSLWPFWSNPNPFNNHISSPCVIRISPDLYYKSWGQEYVLLGSYDELKEASISFHTSIKPRGMCYIVANCHAMMDLVTFEIHDLIVHDSAHYAAEQMLKKIADFIRKSRKEARNGIKKPLNFHDVWTKQKKRDNDPTVDKYCWACIDGCCDGPQNGDHEHESYFKKCHEKAVKIHAETFPKHRIYQYQRIKGKWKRQ